MTGTDPAAFDPESTGTFRVQPLADALTMSEPTIEHSKECGWNPVSATTDCDWDVSCPVHGKPAVPPTPAWLGTTGPALFYADDLGNTVRVDSENYITHPGDDATDQHHRQRLLLRALLQHTLAMLDGEDVS